MSTTIHRHEIVLAEHLRACPDHAYLVGVTVAQPQEAAGSEPQAAPEPQAQDAPEGGEES